MNAKIQPILAGVRKRLEALYGARLAKINLYRSQVRVDVDINVLVGLRGRCSLVRKSSELATRLLSLIPRDQKSAAEMPQPGFRFTHGASSWLSPY